MIKNDEVRVNGSDYINEAWKDKASTKKALLETIGHPDPYKEPNSRFVGKSWEIKDFGCPRSILDQQIFENKIKM